MTQPPTADRRSSTAGNPLARCSAPDLAPSSKPFSILAVGHAPRNFADHSPGIWDATGMARMGERTRAGFVRWAFAISPTAPRPQWQNRPIERLIGSIRRECLDHVIVVGEAHLRLVLKAYASYYNEVRTPSLFE